jgi:hypothetical protein
MTTYQQMWQNTGAPAPEQVAQVPPAYQASQYQASGPPIQRPHIPNHLGWAIAVLLLCFFPTGIAALVYSTQVDSKLAYGDIAGAWESSRKAKMWCWISFGISVAWIVFMILLLVGVGVATGFGDSSF